MAVDAQVKTFIIDGCIFFNETELLKARVSILRDVVDCHLLVEGDRTFQGTIKPWNYKDEYKDRVIYHQAQLPIDVSSWDREYYQRDELVRYAKSYAQSSISDTYLVILLISDIDEIPHPESIQHIRTTYLSAIAEGKIAALHNDTYYYYTNLLTDFGSYPAKAQRLDKVHSGQKLRSSYWDIDVYPKGWHFSYVGDIKAKIRAFSHTELNKSSIIENIEHNVSMQRDLFGRKVQMEYINKERIPKEVWHLTK